MRWITLALASLAFAVRAAAEEPFLLPLPPVATAPVYSADYFEYEGSTSGADAWMILRGSVEVKDSSWTMRADGFTLDMRAREGIATGWFELDDGATVLRGESGRFNFESKSGVVEEVRAEYHPWRVWSRSGRLDSDRKGHFKSAFFTSCEGNPPDYHFRASGLHIKPDKWLIATNARFYVGPIPVFYTPILWKSLNERRLLRTRFIPGYDRRNGGHLRTNTLFSPVVWLQGKAFVDYYGAQGLASGGEIGFAPFEDARGAIYGYQVEEKSSGLKRWTVLGNTYSALNSTWSLQGRLQGQGDPEVNNHYVRSSAFRVTPELVNGGGFTRSTPLSTTRIVYSRLDSANSTRSSFKRDRESLPRIEFQTAQLSPLRLPALFTFTAFADNSYQRARGFQQKSAGTGVEATQTKVLMRGVSLTPRAGFRETFEDRREQMNSFLSTATFRDVFVGYYDLGSNLRFDTPLGDWDSGYSFTRRLKPNSLADDAGALDAGIETSLVSLQNSARPHPKVFIRTGSGYDFRSFRNAPRGFRQRVMPLVGDINVSVRRGLFLSLRESYSLDKGNDAFLVQADWGERDAGFFAAGLTYTKDRADSYFGSIEGGASTKDLKWRGTGALRALVNTPGGADVRGFRLYEKEVSVVRGFHDFFIRVLGRLRPGGIKEVQLQLDLRTDRPAILRKAAKRWEDEWFPWRKGKDIERD